MNITFILPNLRPGGSERVVINLANEFVRRNLKVSIVLISGNDKSLNHLLSNDIKVHDLKLTRYRELIFRPWILFKIFRYIKPDVVVSAFGEINPLIIPFKFFFPNTKFIARESSIPSLRFESYLIKFSYKLFYNLYDLIVIQSNYMGDDLINNFFVDKNKIKLISNPLDIKFIDEKLVEVDVCTSYLGHYILFVGTLDANKRLDKAILFFELLRKNEFKYKLIIIGSGPEFENVMKLVSASNFNNDIILMPHSDNPFIYMKLAQFLIISSNYEGFPNVGIEANYCGTPILLSNSTKGGASELVVDGYNGLVIDFANPDFEKLKTKFDFDRIINTTKLRHNVYNIVNEYLEVI